MTEKNKPRDLGFGRPDPRKAVREFAEAMEGVLQSNDAKGGWGEGKCDIEYLEQRLLDEVDEWKQFESPYELLDIANFCMMLYHRNLGNTDCMT